MTIAHSTQMPAFEANVDGVSVPFVVSVATFEHRENGLAEAIVPAVEEALEHARSATGRELLVAGRIAPVAADHLVAAVQTAAETARTRQAVLWLRTTDKQFATATLAAMRSMYDVRVLHSPTKEAQF